MEHCNTSFRTTCTSLLLLWSLCIQAQISGRFQQSLSKWLFSKDNQSWEKVEIPHSCNALDGHSSSYFRGKTYYKTEIDVNPSQLKSPTFLLFEGAAQTAQISVNNQIVTNHHGGYTSFVVPISNYIKKGKNLISVCCDNHEDVNLIPVSSDFNKNNGLHNPVRLLRMNKTYFSPSKYGPYRLHVSTPKVSSQEAGTNIETMLINSDKKQTVEVHITLKDAKGNVCYQHKETSIRLNKNDSLIYRYNFNLKTPNLWNGLKNPHLYTLTLSLINSKGKEIDQVSTKIGYRFYKMTYDKGFYLNGKPYPLRGIAVHQDWNGKASALTKQEFDTDYQLIHEMGANFVRLAHYPHNDYAFRLCDSLGIVVQTEIPWVNVCGIQASNSYFENIHHQMFEMITNLYNHPSIIFWGMWNELDRWGNTDKLQGKMDASRVVNETGRLYDYAKQLDHYRYVGLTDCCLLRNEGYINMRADYISENRYNGWYYKVGELNTFTKEMNQIHQKGKICNIAEYGAGNNPFCHTTDSIQMSNRKDDTRHYEEYANMVHESHVQQIINMPFLNFTSAWIMFDFAVANRQEGYQDSSDGIHFEPNEYRKYTNDKGLITRDRKTKKDVFYLYKSLWNHNETTVHITSSRLQSHPSNRPIYIKVYSNAKTLTLYQNSQAKATLKKTGENSGVIWTFGPLHFDTDKDIFKIVSNDGTTDQIVLNRGPKILKTEQN